MRRALMRSRALPPDVAATVVAATVVAATVVATRRSGMHTLGADPAAPDHLLERNPGALRRREAVDRVAPGGIDRMRDDPNRPALVELGSGTVDLVVARAPSLDEATAVLLAGRTDPPADPWVLAVLFDRYDAARAAASVHARARLAAADALAA